LYKNNLVDSILLVNEKNKTAFRERELQLSRQLQEVQSRQIHTQNISIAILIVLLFALSVTVFLLFRYQRRLINANKKIELLLKELNHRVKNNLQIVSDMLHLQMHITKDTQQKLLIQSSIDRVESMNIIHTMLYKSGYNGIIDIKNFIETVVTNLSNSYADVASMYDTTIHVQQYEINIDKAISVGLIINELITNIYKYSKTSKIKPQLNVSITIQNNIFTLMIVDNCDQWNFQQYKSKKAGLGLFLIETLVNQLKGKWSFDNTSIGNRQHIEFYI
jgi:two-component system, sensor histidine kinase PdtaS